MGNPGLFMDLALDLSCGLTAKFLLDESGGVLLDEDGNALLEE